MIPYEISCKLHVSIVKQICPNSYDSEIKSQMWPIGTNDQIVNIFKVGFLHYIPFNSSEYFIVPTDFGVPLTICNI